MMRIERVVPRFNHLLAGRFFAVDHVKALEYFFEAFALLLFAFDKRVKTIELLVV